VNVEITKAALSLVENGEDFACARILHTLGSSPRHAGAAMLVRANGSSIGTIGGGPLEATTIKLAREVIETRTARLSAFNSAELGMMCGGGGLVLTQYVDSADPASGTFLHDVLELLLSGRRGWLVTVVPKDQEAAPRVRTCLVDSDGSVHGDPVCSPEVLQELAKRGGTYDRIIADDPASTYVQPIGARGTAYVFGAGHCSEKLAPVLSMIGFSIVIVDDRADFANAERFPTADRIVVPESFSGAAGTLPIDERSYIVIVTRGHSHDTDVLAQALKTPAAYIGMIGSKTKVAKTFAALREQGYSDDDLARVHAPIGLAIGAETPEEIAVSIAAQLIQVRASYQVSAAPLV
jgi:xanthine dehydrogenase accessory factor